MLFTSPLENAMERGYPGGFFVAVDMAQRVILTWRALPELQHVLQHESDLSGYPLKGFQNDFCAMAPLDLCYAVKPQEAVLQPADPSAEAKASPAARLARDVARYLVLYLTKRPYLVHAFYAHEQRSTTRPKHKKGNCGICRWPPKASNRCDYCGQGACTTCVSELSYHPCAHECCQLCTTCHPLVWNETCDVPGCTQLQCARQTPVRCSGGVTCWKRLCAAHAPKGAHVCDGPKGGGGADK